MNPEGFTPPSLPAQSQGAASNSNSNTKGWALESLLRQPGPSGRVVGASQAGQPLRRMEHLVERLLARPRLCAKPPAPPHHHQGRTPR